MNDAATSPPSDVVFDSGGQVPPEYEVFCEGCGYSLAGIVADRCPECGKQYNPAELPFARIPWLHRRRLGWWKAYWATVRMVLFRPRRFALELCRPVRISTADARLFRRITLRIAVMSTFCTFAAMFIIMAWDKVQVGHATMVIMMTLFTILYTAATAVLVTLGTDMPVFIWRGLPSRPPSELAPVHHYAAAPLALLPFAGAAVVIAISAMRLSAAGIEDRELIAGLLAGGVVVMVIAVLLWTLPVILMRAATGCSARRTWALILYLPVHWFIMLALAGMGLALVGMIADPLVRGVLR